MLGRAGLIVVPDSRSLRPESDDLGQLAANPLWAGLAAVAAGKVVKVPILAYNGQNHFAATALLRAVARSLA